MDGASSKEDFPNPYNTIILQSFDEGARFPTVTAVNDGEGMSNDSPASYTRLSASYDHSSLDFIFQKIYILNLLSSFNNSPTI